VNALLEETVDTTDRNKKREEPLVRDKEINSSVREEIRR